MRGEFITRGMQLITSGSDGLLKLWIVKTSEAITTLEAHTNRVWTLAGNFILNKKKNSKSVL